MRSKVSADQDSDEEYEEDQWDKNAEDDGVDEMQKIRNAMEREKKKADKFRERQQEALVTESTSKSKKIGDPRHNPLIKDKNLDPFIRERAFVINEQNDSVAVNRQQVRAKELRDLIQLSQEEQFNMFEMVPQTPQDIYRSKLQAEVIKTQVAATNDEMIDQEVQTDDPGSVSVGTQKPEEQNPKELLARYEEHQKKS